MFLSQRTLVPLLIAAVWCVVSQAAIGQAPGFDLDVTAAILMDASTGQVLFEKNADEVLHPASLTKIMTLLVTMDAVAAGEVKLTDMVRTSRRASQIGGSQVYLAEGETHPLEKMLKAIAIASANDASVAVAEFIAGTEEAFVELMNRRARELGMTRSEFHNSDGLPPGPGESPTLSTARDLAIAARALINNHPQVLQWTSTVLEKFRDSPEFILYNTNGLVSKYDGLDGLKTGHTTAAGWCLVATAKRGEVRLISVVMGAPNEAAREDRTRQLLDYGFFQHVPVTLAQDSPGQLSLMSGNPRTFAVQLPETTRVLVPRALTSQVEGRLVPAENLQAPLKAGDPVGEYVVSAGGRELLRLPALAAVDVARTNLFVRLWRSIVQFVVDLIS